MKKVISILSFLLLCGWAYGQTEQKTEVVEVFFAHDKYAIDLDWGENRRNLNDLTSFIAKLQADTLCEIRKIEINSYTSPEGGRSYNQKLSVNRSNSVYDYLMEATNVPSEIVKKNHSGIDWDGLRDIVESSDMQYRDEVLRILDNVPEETWRRVNPSDRWLSLTDSRNKHLMDLRGGNVYRYMFSEVYPKLRRGSVVSIYFQTIAPPIIEKKIEVAPEPKKEEVFVPEPEPEIIKKPLFALKTNLLFDAVTALNVELEIPIGNRWSIAGEWIFPWWTSCGNKNNSWQSGQSSNRNTLQLLNGNIEGKYWFGDRTNRPVMTGWHVGLYAGGGKYDLERHAEGYQGEFFIAAGISGGYAHTILTKWVPSGNLRMEYSVGIGYLQTDYRYYEEHWGIDDTWHTIRQNNGTYSWFGPTRARVSFVWMLNRNVTKED